MPNYTQQQFKSAYSILCMGLLSKEGLPVIERFQKACSEYVCSTAVSVVTGFKPVDEQYQKLDAAYQEAKSCLVNSGADISMLLTDDRDFVENLARAVVKLCFEKRGR